MKNIEAQFGNENEKSVESKIRLHFFRHAEPERDPQKTNNEFELTNTGKTQAIEKSQEIRSDNLDQSVAFGSPRRRAQQTAGFVMGAESVDSIQGDESLEQLKEKLDSRLKVGSKIGIDPRIDFYLDKNTPFGEKAYDAVFNKKNYMQFLVEESDKLAEELNDDKASTYSRQARNIAEIVKKYIKVGTTWDKLVASGKYKNPELERFLCSHGGVVESFLLKIIEKTKGIQERGKLLKLLPHQFEYVEGLDITITTKGSEHFLHVSFTKKGEGGEGDYVFDEDVPLSILDEIIKEPTIIQDTFNEWTENKNEVESRISIFEHIRDIPYAVIQGRNPQGAERALLLESRGSCTAKHTLLSKMFNMAGVETRFVSSRFRWAELPVTLPDDIKTLAEKMPVCDHLFCEALIDGKWIRIDAVWDSPLEKAGFPVSKWNGHDETTEGVRAIQTSHYPSIKERTQARKELTDTYSEAEKVIEPSFYQAFNAWLEDIRNKNK